MLVRSSGLYHAQIFWQRRGPEQFLHSWFSKKINSECFVSHFYGPLFTGPKWEYLQLEIWQGGQKYFCYLNWCRIKGIHQLTFVSPCRQLGLRGILSLCVRSLLIQWAQIGKKMKRELVTAPSRVPVGGEKRNKTRRRRIKKVFAESKKNWSESNHGHKSSDAFNQRFFPSRNDLPLFRAPE